MAKHNIQNPLTPNSQVINKKVIEDESKVVINFSYKNWFRGSSTNDITTYTESENDFQKHMTFIFEELLPFVYEKWASDKQFGNCHTLHDFDKKRTREANKKYRSIINKLHPSISTDKEDLELFQLGLNNSVRLICGKINNTLYPLLIDHYHLGYDSQFYNQKDFTKFSYCPIESLKNNF